MSQHTESNESEVESQQETSPRELEIASLNKDFSSYTHDGNFCIYFKLIHNRREAEDDIRQDVFFPDFVHQFFTERERIFGYKKPIIRFFYSATRLKRYVRFDYEEKLTKDKDNIEADDVMKMLNPVLEEQEYTQDLNSFISDVESDDEKNFKPPGDLLLECEKQYLKPKMVSRAQAEQIGSQMTNGDAKQEDQKSSNCSANGRENAPTASSSDVYECDATPARKRYQVYHANVDTKNFNLFQARMQTLIMWFIESATMIDFEDPRWDFFMMFERYNPSMSADPEATPLSTEDRYYFVGYATVYRYFAYPDRTRPRVSQMLILPPYRRNGLGTTLLQSIYDFYAKQAPTLDITTEDPDEEFIAMRDFLDCRNCLKLETFSRDNLKKGWTNDMAKEAQEKLKLCRRQARKVYEILKLRNTDQSNEEEERAYRLEIKNRLNIPHRRFQLDCDKVEKLGFELPDIMRAQKDNQKYAMAALEENYRELVSQYRRTIHKLDREVQ